MKRPRFDHFDWVAPFYERAISHINPDRLLNLLSPTPTDRLLDVGGGTGRVSIHLVKHFRQIILTDLSAGMLSEARSKDGLGPVRAKADRLPLADGSVDRILMVDAFHHIGEQAETVPELMRVLATGGRMVVEEPNVDRFSVKLLALAEKMALMGSHFVDPASLHAMFSAHGGKPTLHTFSDDQTNFWLVVEKVSPGPPP